MPSTGASLATLTDCPDAVMIKEILDAGKTGKAGMPLLQHVMGFPIALVT